MIRPLLFAALLAFSSGAAHSQDAEAAVSDRLMLGAGYPDLRLRSKLLSTLDVEAKLAAAEGVMAYSGRAYWQPYRVGAFTLLAGAEAGAFSFSGVEGLNGDGSFYQPFVGVQGRFARRWSAQLDAGPAFMQTRSSGISVDSQPWVLNAALYFSVF